MTINNKNLEKLIFISFIATILLLSFFLTKSNLPLLKTILYLTLIRFITINIKLKFSSALIITLLSYLAAYAFDLRVENRLSPFLTDPNYEALFFILLTISSRAKKQKTIISSLAASIFSGSLTALIASITSNFIKKIWKFLFISIYFYPVLLFSISNLDYSDNLKNLNDLPISSFIKDLGIPEFKIISLQNRFESQINHIENTHASGLIGYGRAESTDLTLSAHNLFVQNFSQNGIILYLLLLPVYFSVFKRLNPYASTTILIFSFTLDIFSFLPIIAAIILCKNKEKQY